MGQIFAWRGKHANYHLELESHPGKRFAITGQLEKRRLKGILLEGNANWKTGAEVLERFKSSEKWLVGGEKNKSLFNEAEKHGVDVWAGDYYSARVHAETIGKSLLVGGIVAEALSPIVRKMTRRAFLKAGLSVAALGALNALFPVATRAGKPAASLPLKLERQIERGTIKERDELAAAKLEYIARHYAMPGELPSVGAVYGKAHAEIGQLVENEEARKRFLEKVSRNPELGLLWKFHFDPLQKKWQVTRHKL